MLDGTYTRLIGAAHNWQLEETEFTFAVVAHLNQFGLDAAVAEVRNALVAFYGQHNARYIVVATVPPSSKKLSVTRIVAVARFGEMCDEETFKERERVKCVEALYCEARR